MDEKIEDLLSFCSEINFGAVNLTDGEKKFCSEWNKEIISLCKSLPESTQIDASVFLMKYSGLSFGVEINFFRTYYVPTWSIIYWLLESMPDDKVLEQDDIRNARAGHSMAMFLHALDDHLNDSEMPVTHLALLLRSHSWLTMNNAFTSLADGVDGGGKIIRGFIDDYYSSICNSGKIESLDCYCDLFRKQMATGMIVPVLMTKKITSDREFTNAIESAYGSFGIAWRLLDDIKDIKTDMLQGEHTSIYICLSEDIRRVWDKDTREKIGKENEYAMFIFNYIIENRVIEIINERICRELELAASIADDCDMTGLANEFRCMLRPMKNK